VSFPITCAHTIVKASTWVGFTLPGIIDDPGSFEGINTSPIPHLGPEDNMRISLAILFKETAICFKAPCDSTMASLADSASNLLLALKKLMLENSDIFLLLN
jgi:hypothetical protein